MPQHDAYKGIRQNKTKKIIIHSRSTSQLLDVGAQCDSDELRNWDAKWFGEQTHKRNGDLRLWMCAWKHVSVSTSPWGWKLFLFEQQDYSLFYLNLQDAFVQIKLKN